MSIFLRIILFTALVCVIPCRLGVCRVTDIDDPDGQSSIFNASFNRAFWIFPAPNGSESSPDLLLHCSKCCSIEEKKEIDGKEGVRFRCKINCWPSCLPKNTRNVIWAMIVNELENAYDPDGTVNETRGNSGNGTSPIVNGDDESPRCCDSVFSSLNFWGANIVIFANMIYLLPYIVVACVYFAVPGLGVRAYDKAVISYNLSQIGLNGILIGIGFSVLCHVSIHPTVYASMGLLIMFLTISSTFWLFVICFDMTLAITGFRWAPPGDVANREIERNKFFVYASWVWLGAFLPSAVAGIVELSPLFPKNSPVRPNFAKFDDGANLSVIVYVATLPALACITNSILFFYTTYKMILIRRLTATLGVKSSTFVKAKKTYFVFVRLYFLMDAPWFTSVLAAVFTDLWVLKFLRMIQPILMLIAILPRRTINGIFKRRNVSAKTVHNFDRHALVINGKQRCHSMRLDDAKPITPLN